MNRINLKKLLILNIPYILVGLFATNLGEAWRLAEGADSSAKILSFFYVLPVALGNPLPSFYPLDLLVGIACGAGLRLAVYLKSKNAKKYRHNVEYGSARWGIIDDDRRMNAERLEAAFYSGRQATPEPVQPVTQESSIDDKELLLKLLQNPEMAALLKSLAKTL